MAEESAKVPVKSEERRGIVESPSELAHEPPKRDRSYVR